ncbi:glycerol-3-phosphate 1-O-acyltransferase PlsY [Candidatus Puniceispirillum sp.]|uniref:glycerol-3-phosphate 1-O-acyltransferase PlsY n=1 Tax=Candidatus Puniceispirillum sp. TaxID=2026719 RepID=UPI003F6A05D3
MLMTSFDYIWIGLSAYVMGSIPFGLVLTHLFGGGDVREIGSGNIGATNVLRTGKRSVAALTLILDAGKGAVAVLLAKHFADGNVAALAGLIAIIGHCFPVWIGFKGGKGVATYLAVMSALDIRFGLIFAVLWLGTAFIARYSSLAALVATMGATIGAFIFDGSSMNNADLVPVFMIVMTGLIWTRHHANIGRLLSGQETKIGQNSKTKK